VRDKTMPNLLKKRSQKLYIKNETEINVEESRIFE
jgi:hypothetical protein